MRVSFYQTIDARSHPQVIVRHKETKILILIESGYELEQFYVEGSWIWAHNLEKLLPNCDVYIEVYANDIEFAYNLYEKYIGKKMICEDREAKELERQENSRAKESVEKLISDNYERISKMLKL